MEMLPSTLSCALTLHPSCWNNTKTGIAQHFDPFLPSYDLGLRAGYDHGTF